MNTTSKLTALAVACAAALSLFAGSLRANEFFDCNVLPVLDVPADLSNLLTEGSGTLWTIDANSNRSELLGRWEYQPCYQRMLIWLEGDECFLSVDLSIETDFGCLSHSTAFFHFLIIDPSRAHDPSFESIVVAEGEMGFDRAGDVWTASGGCVDGCLPVATEVDAAIHVLVDGSYVTTDVRFVGVEPAVCIECGL